MPVSCTRLAALRLAKDAGHMNLDRTLAGGRRCRPRSCWAGGQDQPPRGKAAVGAGGRCRSDPAPSTRRSTGTIRRAGSRRCAASGRCMCPITQTRLCRARWRRRAPSPRWRVRAGVRRLVLLSGRGEEQAQRAEQMVQNAGAEWAVVRCASLPARRAGSGGTGRPAKRSGHTPARTCHRRAHPGLDDVGGAGRGTDELRNALASTPRVCGSTPRGKRRRTTTPASSNTRSSAGCSARPRRGLARPGRSWLWSSSSTARSSPP